MGKSYDEDEIMEKFRNKTPVNKVRILEKALILALEDRAGTREYAIATSMNYYYEDNGSYTYCGKE